MESVTNLVTNSEHLEIIVIFNITFVHWQKLEQWWRLIYRHHNTFWTVPLKQLGADVLGSQKRFLCFALCPEINFFLSSRVKWCKSWDGRVCEVFITVTLSSLSLGGVCRKNHTSLNGLITDKWNEYHTHS